MCTFDPVSSEFSHSGILFFVHSGGTEYPSSL
jgi:hypothetical protein